jgi:DNA primase
MKTTLEEVYSEHVVFSSTGTFPNMMAYCPFHGENPGESNPSLCVDLETGSWICFAGCGGGGLEQFLSWNGVPRHKIEDKTKNVVRSKRKKRREQTGFLNKAVLGIFRSCPTSLLEEGFDEGALFEHDVGFDKELNRITYPVFTRNSELIAVVGRRSNTGFGKYIPYSENELRSIGVDFIPKYEKGNVFWREDKFFKLDTCHDRKEPVILCEGFKAALWLYQHGYPNVMALMGTHLTDRHLSTLDCLGKTVILCLDGDPPGVKSTIKNGYKLSKNLKVLTCHYKGGAQQPDDIKDENEVHEMIENPITITKFKKLLSSRNKK